jgi:hypothetical protein
LALYAEYFTTSGSEGPIRIRIIYGRGKFVGDFNMGNITCANVSTQIMLPILKSPILAIARGKIFTQIMLPISKSPTNLPLLKHITHYHKHELTA